MSDNVKPESGRWWLQGISPDYRFSLANERTFLAWIRTSLALLAGAVGIEQLSLHFASTDIREIIALALCLAASIISAVAWIRWRANERAMRNQLPLPYTRMLFILTIFILSLVITLFLLIILQI